jgi:PAS domain S-box-containing protein
MTCCGISLNEEDKIAVNQQLASWGYILIDHQRIIRRANDKVLRCFNNRAVIDENVLELLPWLRADWLNSEPTPRLVKTSMTDKQLLDIYPDGTRSGWFHIFLRSFDDYKDTDHLWCEAEDLIIGVQKFIDTSYDGVIVENGQGKVLAINEGFLHISGLTKNQVIGKQIEKLVESGLTPHTCSLRAIEERKTCSVNVRYPNGKEAVVSSTPLCDRLGRVIRVISNVRDLSELKKIIGPSQQPAKVDNRPNAEQISNFEVYCKLSRSKIMKGIYDLIPRIANNDLPLLLSGESGVGKTALAKYIHVISERNSRGSFIHVNCSAIPESLLESELFGYEEGAFTGANKSKTGLFELADKGTLLLDEIGDMPLTLQAKILNVLQEKRFYRIGGTKEISVDVRIIAATNMNLEKLIEKGNFRQDLYYRLNVIPLRIPSLAERKEDIPLLINFYLEKCNNRYKANKVLSSEVMDVLLHYEWPGNVREIITIVERMVILIDASINIITLKHLAEFEKNSGIPVFIKPSASNGNIQQRFGQRLGNLKNMLRTVEEEIIEEAIAKSGSLKAASQVLGIDITTLSRKRKKGTKN